MPSNLGKGQYIVVLIAFASKPRDEIAVPRGNGITQSARMTKDSSQKNDELQPTSARRVQCDPVMLVQPLDKIKVATFTSISDRFL